MNAKRKPKAAPRLSLLPSRPAELRELFPQFDEVRHASVTSMLRAEYLGPDAKEPFQGVAPLLRYIPSRETLQRMIRRAALLPKHFDHFD